MFVFCLGVFLATLWNMHRHEKQIDKKLFDFSKATESQRNLDSFVNLINQK